MIKRSKRYQENRSQLEKGKRYPIEEALEIIKKAKKSNFDETIEVHFRLSSDPSKSDQQVRGNADLPHGSGKKVKIAVFTDNPDKKKEAKKAGADKIGGEDLIEKVKTKKSLDCDTVIATPDIMGKLAKIAKILGPRGLMPNPKNETVTENITKAVESLKKGKISFKNDKDSNVHIPIGKVSFTPAQLKENYQVILKAIEKAKPSQVKGKFINNITLTSTMGAGIRIGNK